MNPNTLEKTLQISAATILAIAAFFLVEYTLSRYYLIPQYENIDDELSNREYELIHQAINIQLTSLETFAGYWIASEYAKPALQNQPTDNLGAYFNWKDIHDNVNADFISFYSGDKMPLWHANHNHHTDTTTITTKATAYSTAFTDIINSIREGTPQTGLVETASGIIAITTHPVSAMTSTPSSTPGFIVIGLDINSKLTDSLGQQTGNPFLITSKIQNNVNRGLPTKVISKQLSEGLINQSVFLTVFTEGKLLEHAKKLAKWMSLALITFVFLFVFTIYFFVHTRLTTLSLVNFRATKLVEKRTSQLKRQTEKSKLATAREKQANKSKSLFLANMSHEIRTPMNAILNLSQLCLETNLSERQQDYILKIRRSTSLLMNIVNDILDFSKIESGKLTIVDHDFYLDDVFRQIALLDVVRKEHNDVELIFESQPDVPQHLFGDNLRLIQILNNIVGNALKFTESGYIHLLISRSKEKTDNETQKIWLDITITDTGIGIPQEVIDKLFNVFTQADADTTRKYGGSGLGLVICKELCKLMLGEINLTSNFGSGTIVKIELPFELAQSSSLRKIPELSATKAFVVSPNEKLLNATLNILRANSMNADGYSLVNPFPATNENTTLMIIDEHIDHQQFENWYHSLTAIQLQNLSLYWLNSDGRVQESIGRLVNGTIRRPFYFGRLLESLDYQSGVKTPSLLTLSEPLATQLSTLNILVVDDDEINVQIVEELIGYKCKTFHTANNGLEALLQVDAHTIDLVLMDIQMPVMDGIEATRMIRVNRHCANTIIIALTASAMPEDREAAISTGMNDFVSKPIDPQRFFQTLSKWVNEGNKNITNNTPAKEASRIGVNDELGVLNVQQGLKNCMDNNKLYQSLLKKFVIRSQELVREFDIAINDRAIDDASRRLHALKGLSGTVGAVLLTANAVKLEETLKRGALPESNELSGFKQSAKDTVDMICDLLSIQNPLT